MSRRITALTKQGIKGLQMGHHVDAILSFRHALECLKTARQEQGPQEEQNCRSYYSSADDQDEVDSHDLPVANVPVSSCYGDDTSYVIRQFSPHNIFHEIYESAFVFGQVDNVVDCEMEISAILFYNQALAHHLAGLSSASTTSSTDRNKHFQEAIRCYKIALTICNSSKGSSFQVSFALVLGSLTNLGFLCDHFLQTEAALSCLVHVDQVLISAEATVMALMDEETIEFFCSMVAYTRASSSQIQVAPAA